MDKKEANTQLAAMVKVFEEQLLACERFADLHKLSFSISPAYGMGGYYYGDPEERYDPYGNDDDKAGGWSPSSVGC